MIIPVGPRMLVKPLPQEDIEVGCIFIPGVVNANLFRAEVVRLPVGDVPTDEAGIPIYKIGDVVVYPRGSGTGHREGTETYLWLQFGEVQGMEVPEEEDKKVKKLKV